jgi:hypothetical protein
MEEENKARNIEYKTDKGLDEGKKERGERKQDKKILGV